MRQLAAGAWLISGPTRPQRGALCRYPSVREAGQYSGFIRVYTQYAEEARGDSATARYAGEAAAL